MSETPHIDVAALASLARIDVSADELAALREEIPTLLSFVEEIQRAPTMPDTPEAALRNVMRDDTEPHEPAAYTDDLLAAVPRREGAHVAVDQVIRRDDA